MLPKPQNGIANRQQTRIEFELTADNLGEPYCNLEANAYCEILIIVPLEARQIRNCSNHKFGLEIILWNKRIRNK